MNVNVGSHRAKSVLRRGIVSVSVVALAALLAAPRAAGQSTGGRIRGTVTDPSGGAVVGTKVVLTNEATRGVREAATGGTGEYVFLEVPVGSYELSIQQQGFKKYLRKGVGVDLNEVLTVDIALQLGGTTEVVEVTGAPPVIDTTSTQLGAVLNDRAVTELPLNARNTYQLLQLQPGVQSQLGADLFYGSDQPGVVSVNGGRGRSNNFMVNGGDGNDIFVNLPAIQPSPDAIDEFRVLTNTFDAEYGRNSGSVVNVVTKSGSNQVHGDFYDFFRNKILNTKGFFDPFVPDYKQNQFGATLGGPIKKDRTFIFGSYEGNRLHKGISSGSVFLPTAAQAGGDFSLSGPTFTGTLINGSFATLLASRTTGNTGRNCQAAVTAAGGPTIAAGTSFASIFPGNKIPIECFDPTALALYNLYVKPFGTGQIALAPNRIQRGDQFTVRFDHHISTTQQFNAYYYFDDDHRTDPFSNFQAAGANLPGFGAIFTTRVQQWNLSHTWTIGSSAVNEFRFNYFREGQANLDHPVSILNSVHNACGAAIPATNCFTDPTNPAAGITTNIPGREGVPDVTVSGGFVIGNNFEGELPQVGNTFQWADNYTKTLGKHTMKFGGDVRRQRFDQFLYFEINGLFTFFSNANLCSAANPNTTSCTTPSTNDVGFSNSYPNYLIGTPGSYNQGAAQGEDLRNTGLYLFWQDSYKLRSNLTLNYGLRWELNTPYYDLGNRLQTFRPGQIETQYPCLLNANNPFNPSSAALATTYGSTDCSPTGPANAVFPLGMVFPNDKGIQRGLTSTYYKAFAPRIGLAWSPGASSGWLSKLTGGPGKSSIRAGWGIFYNPIEQLVLEQFSAEPPFGGSAFFSNPLFNLPFELQSGTQNPNAFQGIINQTPQTPCFNAAGPKGCVDFAEFRPLLLFGEFQRNLKTQYSDQYNLTIQRQMGKDMLLRVAYVGTQGHRLLASHDLNYGHAETCLELNEITPGTCGPFGSDSSYFIPPTAVIPAYVPPPGAPTTPQCTGLTLPYNAGTGGTCIPAGTTVSSVAPNGINLVGLRRYSSPLCQPLNVNPSLGPGIGVGCPADGVPVFSNIFAQDTIANSNYNALQVSLDKHYSHGLLFQAAYTFSKAIDQGASFENELNPLNFRATRGLSLLHAKHRFVFSPYWELPIPKHAGFAGKAINGWGASAIITYQTGFPIRMQTQDDLELQSSIDFEGANTPLATGPIQFLNPKKNGNFYFNTSNISDPPAGTFGNLPHSVCCGPAISDTDLVISKKTSINERWNTEFRAEFYNAWNHTQFENPDGNFTHSTFGLIQKARDPRLIQFGLKILF